MNRFLDRIAPPALIPQPSQKSATGIQRFEMLITKCFIAFFALVAIGTAVKAQFRETPPAPYPQNVARDRIRAVLQDVNLDNRQQAIATVSGLLVWYRDLIDDELIAAWQRDGKAGMPQVIEALADSRVASDVVEFSWHQRREATFNLTYAPMLGHLMARYPDSAKIVSWRSPRNPRSTDAGAFTNRGGGCLQDSARYA
jgi:hypothetical protein